MRYKSFEIENFKGIKHTKIELEPAGGKFFTLVGLNESGKTTLLEAIHSFSPDEEHQVIFSESSFAKQDKGDLIPKHRLANFTDMISVAARVALEQDDVNALKAFSESSLAARLDVSQLPNEFKSLLFLTIMLPSSKSEIHGGISTFIPKRRENVFTQNRM